LTSVRGSRSAVRLKTAHVGAWLADRDNVDRDVRVAVAPAGDVAFEARRSIPIHGAPAANPSRGRSANFRMGGRSRRRRPVIETSKDTRQSISTRTRAYNPAAVNQLIIEWITAHP
ncbi:MAG: hypothetical protein ACRDPM_24260, partial [Solirubrobacteraceae bacterium]